MLFSFKKKNKNRSWWLAPVITATREAEIERIMVQGQLEQILHETQSPK
jgi:hypothetical protein